MYKLYWDAGTAAMAPQTLLEEIGAPYEAIRVNVEAREHRQAAYRKLNPTGYIPTLVDGEFAIFETVAICLYLCDKHPAANLAPPAGTPERGRFYQWLTYMTNTVQVAFTDWFHPDRTFVDPAHHAAFKAASEARLARSFDVLDGGIGARRWMIGQQYTACDIYLTMMTRWSRLLAKPMWHWPNIRRIAGAAHVRPAFQRMMQKQNIAWPETWPAA